MANPPRKILYVQYAAPGVYPPIERSARIFKNRGWQVGFLGVRAKGASANLTANLHSEDEIEYFEHRPGGLSALRSYARFCWRALRRVQQEKPDVVYVSDPAWAYAAGLLISWLTSALIVMHEHDTPRYHSMRIMRVIQAVRRRLLRRADILVNPQPDRARDMVAQAGGREVMVVYNCPSQSELTKTLHFDDKPDGLILWHHGSLSAQRMPYAIVDALAQLPADVRLEIAGYETKNSAGYVDSILARAAEIGVGNRVVYHGALKRDDLYAKAARAHVGLSGFVQEFAEPMVGASNKPFDYLGCTMALLVNDTEEWRDFFASRDVAVSCNPEEGTDIARVVGALYDDRGTLARLATRGRVLIETEWNYDAQFQPVLDKIETLLTEQQPKR